jgi:hypothetical protein
LLKFVNAFFGFRPQLFPHLARALCETERRPGQNDGYKQSLHNSFISYNAPGWIDPASDQANIERGPDVRRQSVQPRLPLRPGSWEGMQQRGSCTGACCPKKQAIHNQDHEPYYRP